MSKRFGYFLDELKAQTPLARRIETMAPESVWDSYVVNAPASKTTVWSMAKSLLDPLTVSKIHITGTVRTTSPPTNPPSSAPMAAC